MKSFHGYQCRRRQALWLLWQLHVRGLCRRERIVPLPQYGKYGILRPMSLRDRNTRSERIVILPARRHAIAQPDQFSVWSEYRLVALATCGLKTAATFERNHRTVTRARARVGRTGVAVGRPLKPILAPGRCARFSGAVLVVHRMVQHFERPRAPVRLRVMPNISVLSKNRRETTKLVRPSPSWCHVNPKLPPRFAVRAHRGEDLAGEDDSAIFQEGRRWVVARPPDLVPSVLFPRAAKTLGGHSMLGWMRFGTVSGGTGSGQKGQPSAFAAAADDDKVPRFRGVVPLVQSVRGNPKKLVVPWPMW